MNPTFRIVLPLLFLAMTVTAQELKPYQWKNRILLFFGSGQDMEAWQNQRDLFTAENAAMEERDLIWFALVDGEVRSTDGTVGLSAPTIRRNYGISDTFAGVVLIGKDGGVKFKEPFPVKPETIFVRIDGMPMRRAEMRNDGKG